ncbi:MAG: hypothetical protein FRX48_09295 [Lasallia pustulata]|uniref:Uncharacterized protein n=1 Tax=Lasallia pustulata TaxID=136370 RepID=A0A5M8PCH6_9LECA|nr:MAG: hypothetical protein FRX48_09295 [Lasallia pustulata]
MKEALIHSGPKVEIIGSPVPEPGPTKWTNHKLSKPSTTPDMYTKLPQWTPDKVINQGNDIAGDSGLKND